MAPTPIRPAGPLATLMLTLDELEMLERSVQLMSDLGPTLSASIRKDDQRVAFHEFEPTLATLSALIAEGLESLGAQIGS